MVIRCSIRSSMASPPSPLAAYASRVLHMGQPSAIRRLHISLIATVICWGCGPQPREEWGGGPRPQFVSGGGDIAGRSYRGAELSRGGVIAGRSYRGAGISRGGVIAGRGYRGRGYR